MQYLETNKKEKLSNNIANHDRITREKKKKQINKILTQKLRRQQLPRATHDFVPYREMLPVEWLPYFVVVFHFAQLKDQSQNIVAH